MRGRQLWWIPLPIVAADRLLKLLAVNTLADHTKTAIPGVLSWQLTKNTGAAFSMLSGRSVLLIALTVALIAGLTVYLLRAKNLPVMACVGLWSIVGGGIGNLWDRLACGGVIDFIRLDFISFPIFNAADVFVCVGAGLTLLAVLTAKGGAADA